MSSGFSQAWPREAMDGSVGVEEEFFLIDRVTGECSAAAELILDGCEVAEREIVEEIVETSTAICRSSEELLDAMVARRRRLADAAGRTGHVILASGTHPACEPAALTLTDEDRFRRMQREFPWVWRETHTCGMHVHVGVSTADRAVQVCDQLQPWLPTLLALSANSPLWRGEATGLASLRALLIQMHPRSGMPPRWESWGRYVDLIESVTTTSGDDGSWFWWFTKPHATHGTVEVRVCDSQTDVHDAHALAMLITSLCAALGAGRTLVDHADDPAGLLLDDTMWNALHRGVDGRCLVTASPMTLGEHAALLIDAVGDDLPPECTVRLRRLAKRSESVDQVADLERLGDPLAVALATSARSAAHADATEEPAPLRG